MKKGSVPPLGMDPCMGTPSCHTLGHDSSRPAGGGGHGVGRHPPALMQLDQVEHMYIHIHIHIPGFFGPIRQGCWRRPHSRLFNQSGLKKSVTM